MKALPFLDAEALARALSWTQAIDALEAALAADPEIAATAPRSQIRTAHGELLLMPAESSAAVGVKLVSLAPRNPERGLPRIHGLYVLLDSVTLVPRLLIDGAALTALRTPAVSALAVRRLAGAEAATLTVFGTGPQAAAHIHALRAIRPISTVTVVGRSPGPTADLVGRLRADGLAATAGTPDDVRHADIVVCATNAGTALFDGRLTADHACVVAVGSHRPDARELDDQVFARACRVVVEDRATALREAGDIVLAIDAGVLSGDALVPLADLPALPPVAGLTVFKSVGMGWQDLVIAEAAWTSTRQTPPHPSP